MAYYLWLAHVGFHESIGKIADGILHLHRQCFTELCAHLRDGCTTVVENDSRCPMFSAGFVLFARATHRNLRVGWVSTLLTLLTCVFAPILTLLYYGERIHMASKCVFHGFE